MPLKNRQLQGVIIESDAATADHLETILASSCPSVFTAARFNSIDSALNWLTSHQPDLIFTNTRVGGDSAFRLSDHPNISARVIYTSENEQDAFKAFQHQGSGYLLHPVKPDELTQVLNRLSLQGSYENRSSSSGICYQRRFLVRSGNELKPLTDSAIAYLFVQGRHIVIVDMDGTQYLFDQTLESIESRLDPACFFRINRQIVLSYRAIQSLLPYSRGRLKVRTNPPFKDEMIVSIDRALSFKNWLSN